MAKVKPVEGAIAGYVRERICGCGRADIVRKDNKSSSCKSCSARRAGAIALVGIKARAKRSTCSHCGGSYQGKNKNFCSRKCRVAATPRLDRECKFCGTIFNIRACVLKTNASGNFCSRPCYESYLCRTGRATGMGSRWHAARQKALANAPFCAVCGTGKGLQVHHIIPFRISRHHDQWNLVPLCVRHHKTVEMMFVETEIHSIDDAAVVAWVSMIRERQMVTATKLRSLHRAMSLAGQEAPAL